MVPIATSIYRSIDVSCGVRFIEWIQDAMPKSLTTVCILATWTSVGLGQLGSPEGPLWDIMGIIYGPLWDIWDIMDIKVYLSWTW